MRWLAALFFLMGTAFAQSQQPAPIQETPKTAASPAQEQRGTKDNPFTVNVEPTEEQKAAAEKQDVESKLKAADDKKLIEYTGDQVLIGIVTFLIFLLQLVAFIAQACYMRKSASEMRRTTRATISAARAAQKSADVAEAALKIAERPYLVPQQPKMNIWRYGQPGMPVTMSNPPEYLGIIKYGVFNLGRTVALLKEITICLAFVKELPDQPDYRIGLDGLNNADTRALIGHFPIKHDGTYECPDFPIGGKRKIDADTFRRLQSGELKAFLFGYFRYADLFDYLHTEGFCFRYLTLGIDQGASTCAIVAGKNYNYKRSEKIPVAGLETIQTQGAELTFDDIAKLNANMIKSA